MKIIKAAAALMAGQIILTLGTGVGAANISQIARVQNAILAKKDSQAQKTDDVNEDGKVDSKDLTLLKQQANSEPTGEYKDVSFEATSENVKRQSRIFRDSNVTWLTQSGSAVEFTLQSAKKASVTLAGKYGIDNKEDLRPRYAVYVNGNILKDSTLSAKSQTIDLEADGKDLNVKIIMLSEAAYGAVGVDSIDVTSNSVSPIVPARASKYRVEFVGDSITCAYGVEGKSNGDQFKTTTENFTKSYAYLAASRLGVDYDTLCYSGHGVISGFSDGKEKNLDAVISDYYDGVSKFEDYKGEWNFADDAVDAVFINLGTNDINYVTLDKEKLAERSEEFIDGYIGLIKKIRALRPKAKIIGTCGTMGGADIYKLEEQAVQKYTAETGDTDVSTYESPVQDGQTNGYGSDWHPNEISQKESSYLAADKIANALGIESDQYGLDVAMGAKYSNTQNAADGANQYTYVNDYDKSVWVSVSAGGNSEDDVEALLSGIDLKKGAKYVLSFDYTSDIPFTVNIKDKDGKVLASTGVDVAADKTSFSKDVKIDAKSPNSSIVFELGGQGAGRTTLYKIKLTRMG